MTYKEFIQKTLEADERYMTKLDEHPGSIFLTVQAQGVN